MFIAGYNIPGYMPETTPELFETPAEAWEYLADEVRHVQNDTYDEVGYDLLGVTAMELAGREDTGEVFGNDGYVYWVSPAEYLTPHNERSE